MEKMKGLIENIIKLRSRIKQLNDMLDVQNPTSIDIDVFGANTKKSFRFYLDFEVILGVIASERDRLAEQLAPLERKLELLEELIGDQ